MTRSGFRCLLKNFLPLLRGYLCNLANGAFGNVNRG